MRVKLENPLKAKVTVLACFLVAAAMAFAADTSALRPPKGSPVAIVVFEDLQCPDCARAEPILTDAQKETKVPLVRHDFPLPQHNWSFDAHVIARYLDTKSAAVGEEYRHWLFTNQSSITKANLRGMSERFAEDHKVQLPENVDPKGKLAEKVKADFILGQQVGVQHTPTIFVVSDTVRGQPFVEVVDRAKLVGMVNTMKAQAAAEKRATAKKTVAKKKQ
jgi:protein-disulfide isomerase